MDRNKLWLKFILTGKAEDYLKYINARSEIEEAVDRDSHFNRGAGDSAEQHWR